MVPDWLIHRLDATELKRLAEAYHGLAGYLAAKADQLAKAEAIRNARQKAARTRRDAKAELHRAIWRRYQAGRSDAEIGKAVALSPRQVRRILKQLLTPALARHQHHADDAQRQQRPEPALVHRQPPVAEARQIDAEQAAE